MLFETTRRAFKAEAARRIVPHVGGPPAHPPCRGRTARLGLQLSLRGRWAALGARWPWLALASLGCGPGAPSPKRRAPARCHEQAECELQLSLRHPNILQVFGGSWNLESIHVSIVMEFCDRGTLEGLLANEPTRDSEYADADDLRASLDLRELRAPRRGDESKA